MIAEGVVVLEPGASAENIARTTHAHPTLYEAFLEAALQVSSGTATHIWSRAMASLCERTAGEHRMHTYQLHLLRRTVHHPDCTVFGALTTWGPSAYRQL
ncbi:hypothetical protein H4582DRAFT_1977136 [Lactarius indigo]|nr:hypothetical protein H4582DRAFT_1977136 [Lactarius indigo]